jgi:hypothetical protein
VVALPAREEVKSPLPDHLFFLLYST